MHLGRRRTRRLIRSLVPLLVLVWASLPLHRCYLAQAAAPAAPSHCHHQAPDDGAAARHVPAAQMPCSELGKAGPDVRPAMPDISGVASLVAIDSQRGLRVEQIVPRSRDSAPPPLRALHLRKSVLLI